jgi:hypothetical protein
MTSLSAVMSRLRGNRKSVRTEIAELRELILETKAMTVETHRVVMSLNHEVHAGVPSGLPLFVGFAERLRTDAETAVGAAETIDRQLRRLEQRLSAPTPTVTNPDA